MKSRIIRICTELTRQHISVMILITLVDIALTLLNEDVAICFAALLPQQILILGLGYSALTGVTGFAVWTIVLTVISVALYLLCLIFSYRRPGWLIVAAVMTALDSAVGVALVMLGSKSYTVDIITHVWIVIALIAGYILAKIGKKPAVATCDISADEETEPASPAVPTETVEISAEAPAEITEAPAPTSEASTDTTSST